MGHISSLDRGTSDGVVIVLLVNIQCLCRVFTFFVVSHSQDIAGGMPFVPFSFPVQCLNRSVHGRRYVGSSVFAQLPSDALFFPGHWASELLLMFVPFFSCFILLFTRGGSPHQRCALSSPRCGATRNRLPPKLEIWRP